MYTDALHLLGLLFYQFEGNTKSAIQHLRAAVLSQSQLRQRFGAVDVQLQLSVMLNLGEVLRSSGDAIRAIEVSYSGTSAVIIFHSSN